MVVGATSELARDAVDIDVGGAAGRGEESPVGIVGTVISGQLDEN